MEKLEIMNHITDLKIAIEELEQSNETRALVFARDDLRYYQSLMNCFN